MKIRNTLSVSVIVGAILLTGTACSSTAVNESSPSPSSSSSISDTETLDTQASDTEAVLTTVNGYYSFIANPESQGKIKQAESEITTSPVTDKELQEFATNFSEGFQYFDTSTSQLIQNAYKAMMLGSSVSQSRPGLEITVPANSVSIDGQTATVNTTWVSVTEDGKTFPTDAEANPNPDDLINLVKKDDGSWVIVAKASSVKTSTP
jgi:hypothetical protein